MKNMSLERKAKISKVQRIILESVKVAGVIAVGVMAPNVLAAMRKSGLITHNRQIESVKRSKDILVKNGLLKIKGDELSITEKGHNYLQIHVSIKSNKKNKWDKKWRVLIFDIPEERRHDRNEVRRMLTSLGFMRLQDSVWIYPYPCEDLITLLKAETETEKDLLYMIVDLIENERELKEYFGLK